LDEEGSPCRSIERGNGNMVCTHIDLLIGVEAQTRMACAVVCRCRLVGMYASQVRTWRDITHSPRVPMPSSRHVRISSADLA
jgi:hypothetical protein